ncbi:unnamed protein product [Dibothriocephalus latus]|uniref:Uncharacterized protein n=1 Tax=Dibothriocephalus latus TaxID=60516 RepID=A0A3P7LL53_DIBLA|nr:unnamed protein product [Dibothriocephalus latus]
MMAPTCLLLLLLFLGHSQAAKVTVKPAERTTAGLVFPIEADFAIKDIVSVPAPTGEAAKTEPLVKFPSEQTCIDAFTPPCSDIVSGTSKLNVTIDLKSEQVTLMLEGAKGEQVQAVFVPGSAAGWMTPASALIFASLALLFFLH